MLGVLHPNAKHLPITTTSPSGRRGEHSDPHSLTLGPSAINNVDGGEGTTAKQQSPGRLVGDDEVHFDKRGSNQNRTLVRDWDL